MPPLAMRSKETNSIQGSRAWVDGMGSVMGNIGERRRTIVAVVSASVISVVVWGLIVVLHVQ